MRLVVHMGPAKTASTYLQRCLGLNEEVLRRHGIYLPQTGRRLQANLNHHNLAWHLLQDPRFRSHYGDWDGLVHELSDADADIVLLSSEAFSRFTREEPLRIDFSRRLSSLTDDVTLLFVVRDPLSRINSMYAQTIKTFASPGSFDEYATKAVRSGSYDLDQSFRFWYGDNRVRLRAIRFDELVEQGPLQRLLQALGVDIAEDDLTIPDDVSNPTPGPVAVEAIRLLNAHLRVVDPDFSRRSGATAKLSQVAQRRAGKVGWNDQKFWGWEPDRARWAAERLRPSNERFAQAVWGTSWPLSMPIAKPRTAIALVDEVGTTRRAVDKYVAAMTKRYVELLADMSRKDTGEDVEVEESPLDDEILDDVPPDKPAKRSGAGAARHVS